jgi:hypothetical protein
MIIKPDPIFTTTVETQEVRGSRSIFDNYRSYTYRVTFACVNKSAIQNPTIDFLESNTRNYWIVARNYGKGNLSYNNADAITRTSNLFNDSNVKSTVEEFLRESPGRYDFYIDNLEINSYGLNLQTGMSAHTKLSFDIIEPYSMNGFFEALQMAAVAMGYVSYIGIPFVLALDFVGYEGTDIASIDELPKIIPQSTRLFFITLYKSTIQIDETGTKYRVDAVPLNELSYADDANKLKKNLQISGSTVDEILTSVVNGLEEQREVQTDDIYEIKFPEIKSDGDINWESTVNDISKAKVRDITKLNGLIKFSQPGEAGVAGAYGARPDLTGATISAGGFAALAQGATLGLPLRQPIQNIDPTSAKPLIQFPENSNITDIITSVVNGSDYIKKIIDRITNGTAFKPNETINYYQIQSDVTIDKPYNEVTQRPVYRYTYYVLPYAVHHSRVSLNSNIVQVSSSKVESELAYDRTYSYSYTGENEHIIDFKMDFELSFYSPVPYSVNKTVDKDPSPATKLEVSKKSLIAPNRVIPPAASRLDPQSARRNSYFSNTDSGNTPDNYDTLAQMIHRSFLMTSGLANADITILGDTSLLLTAGLGNYRPKKRNTRSEFLENGELNSLSKNLTIRLIFKNPTDIDKQTGELKFRNKFDTFSGIYTIISIVHKFNQGIFTQLLNLKKIINIADKDEDLTSNLVQPSLEQAISDAVPQINPLPTFPIFVEPLPPPVQ